VPPKWDKEKVLISLLFVYFHFLLQMPKLFQLAGRGSLGLIQPSMGKMVPKNLKKLLQMLLHSHQMRLIRLCSHQMMVLCRQTMRLIRLCRQQMMVVCSQQLMLLSGPTFCQQLQKG
jgi:hypothetical protein